ncbi:MAG: hypothetical protein NW201_03415 [Gemmatimonadales bacterium]|nr:hypothetical protein [Gemmatimonadales bacterium]
MRAVGDERPGAEGDTMPARGRTRLAPALEAAVASGRRVIVVTDGEVEDAAELDPAVLAAAEVRVVARRPVADVALVAVRAPERIAARDTLVVEADVAAFGGASPDSARVELMLGARRLARAAVRARDGSARVRLVVPPGQLPPGQHVLTAALARPAGAPAGDDPRTDARTLVLTVVPTPGIVLLAAPADWDATFLQRTLAAVTALPVKGFVRLGPTRWFAMGTLTPVTDGELRATVRDADLLVLKGATAAYAQLTRAAAIWKWPSGEQGEGLLTGDWYLRAPAASPLAGAFAGLPVDSFPPASALVPLDPPEGAWSALTAQEGRRGAERPAVVGREEGGGQRTLTVGVDGLWRWAFRGGSSELAYRAWVGSAVSWLLGGVDRVGGVARPARPVVQQGRPLVFAWTGAGAPVPTAVALAPLGGTPAAAPRADTLRFDGTARATLWLPPGDYRYRLQGGGEGLVSVETFSDEFLPREVTLAAKEGRVSGGPAARRSAREALWLFAMAVAALAAEWTLRRRLGLR